MELKTEQSKKLYEFYFKRINRIIATLPSEDKRDIRMEIESHLYESMSSQPSVDEVTSLINAIQHLGEPEDFLGTLVAERKLKQATKSFNPKHIYAALLMQIGRGVSNTVKYTVFGLLYLFTFVFGLLGFAKFVAPQNVGYFIRPDGHRSFGWIYGSEIEGATEVLGYWIVPICILASCVLYVLTTLLMKVFSK